MTTATDETKSAGNENESSASRGAWPRMPHNLRIGLRLVYIIAVLAATVPLIFYGLAAYQYQQDVEDLATQDDNLSAKRLMAQAATWNEQFSAWADAVEQGVLAEQGVAGATAANRQELQQLFDTAVERVHENRPPSANAAAGKETARVLAMELYRFDRLGLPVGIDWYATPSELAKLPSWALTLLVTLLAGLLGSLIYVLKLTLQQLLESWSEEKPRLCQQQRLQRPSSWLVLRPVFGMVTALGAYVALQSGLLVFDGQMSISPSAYVTAAVALIAGLLSWQMIDALESLGERWLNRQRAQWGYGLAARITGDDDTEAQTPGGADTTTKNTRYERQALADTLGVSLGVMNDWVDLRTPVPAKQAERLAAELRVDPDVLFAPVPPWRRGPRAERKRGTATSAG